MSVLAAGVQTRELAKNPIVSSELFDGHAEAKLWVGKLATLGVVEKPELYDAELRMRAAVYINEMGFLGPEHADILGREHDEYDDQSVHFGIFQNVQRSNSHSGRAKLIGTSRLIVKEDDTQNLPIESDFKDIFDKTPINIPAVEVSRFISRDKNQMRQHSVAISLIRAMTYEVAERNIDTAYFEIEKPLLKLLKVIGLPLETIGPEKIAHEPGGERELYPIKITPSKIINEVKTDEYRRFKLQDFFTNEAPNKGLGYYSDTLVGGEQ